MLMNYPTACKKAQRYLSFYFFRASFKLIDPYCQGDDFRSSGAASPATKKPFCFRIISLDCPRLKTHTLRKYPDAIHHSPNFYLPPNVNRHLATFHDLSVFTWLQCHPAERVRLMQKELLLTIKRADILITDSEFTRLELAEYLNWLSI